MILRQCKVGLIVTGGIAAYKATEIVRQLVKAGAQVRVMMTRSACEFITPLTMQILSRHAVLLDTFDEKDPDHVQHIEFATWCDMVVVAPATANILAKLANGIADDICSTTLLAVTSPCLICPAMNNHMWQHPATQRNINQLKEDGYEILEPAIGFLAEGYEGKGRLPEINIIIQKLEALYARHSLVQLLSGKKVLVTAGGTKERIDPVRYISNDSSGKMGYALATYASWLGADVSFITSHVHYSFGGKVETIPVETALEMQAELEQRFEEADYVIMAAAVSDYRMKEVAPQKIKKNRTPAETILWELVENPDIIAGLGRKKTHQILVGFAAETQDVVAYAKEKLIKKHLDWVIANDVSRSDIGFNAEANQVTLLHCQGSQIDLPKMGKLELASDIWQQIIQIEEDKRKVHDIKS